MANIVLNGIAYSEIPQNAEYPYTTIVMLAGYGMVMDMVFLLKKPLYFISASVSGESDDMLDTIGTSDYLTYQATEDGSSWELVGETVEGQVAFPIVTEGLIIYAVNGSNYDIKVASSDTEGNLVETDEVWLPGDELQILPDEMKLPTSVLMGLGIQVRRVSGVCEKLKPTDMVNTLAQIQPAKDYLALNLNGTIGTYSSEEVRNVRAYGFYCCILLTSVNLPNVESIGELAFGSCLNLTSVNFPVATEIGKGGFALCSSITKVDFGAVEKIYDTAFASCGDLESLIIRTTSGVCKLMVKTGNGDDAVEEEKYSSHFLLANSGMKVYVPSALLADYQANAAWQASGKTILAIEDYPDICGTT